MIDLSIVILFSDKDKVNAIKQYKKLKALNYKYIQILLVDNGTESSNIDGAVRFEHIPVMYTRRDILPYCKGKYVWYVDGDDNIESTKIIEVLHRNINKNIDSLVVSFATIVENGNMNLGHTDYERAYCSGLWGRIIKKDLLQEMYNNICYTVQTFEDTIILYYLDFLNAKTYCYRDDIAYRYNSYLSAGFNKDGYYLRDINKVMDYLLQNRYINFNLRSFLINSIFEIMLLQSKKTKYFDIDDFLETYFKRSFIFIKDPNIVDCIYSHQPLFVTERTQVKLKTIS